MSAVENRGHGGASNQADDAPGYISPWRPRLVIFWAVAVLSIAAGYLVYQHWISAAWIGAGEAAGAANPALSLPERLYLQLYLATHADELRQVVGDGGETPLTFEVAPGQTASQIADRLVAQGALQPADEALFLNYLHFYGLDLQLEAGRFQLSRQLTIPQLAAALTQAGSPDITLTFLEGWRLEEFVAYLEATRPGNMDPLAFQALVQRQTPFDLTPYTFLASTINDPNLTSLEGFLFPDTYRVPLEADAAYVVDLLLRTFDARVTPAMRQAYGAQGLTLRQAVTVASIVEREAVLADEQSTIASVYLNRLNLGMKLDADPTVQYAVGFDAQQGKWWKTPLTLEDLQLDSPYNTYRQPGLPPGPIANPGLGALQAVAYPAQTAYLFFVADCSGQAPGSHLFSFTYEEHLAYVAACR